MQPEEFRRIRKALGLNQTALAKRLGLSPGWISRMEQGVAEIEPRTAMSMLYLELTEMKAPETGARS